MTIRIDILFLKAVGWLCILLAFSQYALGAKWLPITEQEWKSTECPFDPDADAEVLFKSLIWNEGNPKNAYREYYLRIKIYDEAGTEGVANYSVSFDSRIWRLGSHSVRVARADGGVEEVRETETTNRGEEQSTTFVLPDLKPGDIIDFNYRINKRENRYSRSIYIPLQERWPVRKAKIHARPSTLLIDGETRSQAMRVRGAMTSVPMSQTRGTNDVRKFSRKENVGVDIPPSRLAELGWMVHKLDAAVVKEKPNDLFELELEGLQAIREESHQPPEKGNVAWVMFYKSPTVRSDDAYWKGRGRILFEEMESVSRPGKRTRATIERILSNVSGDEEKLKAIYAYCVNELVNSVHHIHGRLSPKDLQKIDRNMKAEGVLAQGFGNPYNIDTAFCALARAAGFDARLAAIAAKDDYGFSTEVKSFDTVMSGRCIAISRPDGWQYFKPGGKYLPFEQLDWQEQGVTALISDKNALILEKTPISLIADTIEARSAKLKLDGSGGLKGNVEMRLTGHAAVEMKRLLDEMPEAGRKQVLRDRFEEAYPHTTITSIELYGLEEPLMPLRISFQVDSSTYAEPRDKGFALQANFFRKSAQPEFPSADRVSDIYFKYASSEVDEVEIVLPDGFAVGESSSPKRFRTEGVFEYEPRLEFRKESNTLVYSSRFSMEGARFPVEQYKLVQSLFDEKHRQDQRAITLRR